MLFRAKTVQRTPTANQRAQAITGIMGGGANFDYCYNIIVRDTHIDDFCNPSGSRLSVILHNIQSAAQTTIYVLRLHSSIKPPQLRPGLRLKRTKKSFNARELLHI